MQFERRSSFFITLYLYRIIIPIYRFEEISSNSRRRKAAHMELNLRRMKTEYNQL